MIGGSGLEFARIGNELPEPQELVEQVVIRPSIVVD
jgi:hypothetical protein